MGKINSGGILGQTVGKVGPVVGRKWKGINTLSSYQPNVANPNTAGQQIQRSKMSIIVAFLKVILLSVIRPLWNKTAIKTTGWANAIKANILTVSDLGVIDYANVKLAIGARLTPAISAVTAVNGSTQALVSFSILVTENENSDFDKMYSAIYNATTGKWGRYTAVAELQDGEINVDFGTPLATGDLLKCYLMSTDPTGEIPGDSKYFAKVVTVA